MFDRIVVPTDGSDAAWRAVVVGDRLAAQCGGQLELVHAYVDADDAASVKRDLEYRIGTEDIVSAPFVAIRPMQHTVARTIVEYVAPIPGHQIVMSSAGHGRSAVVLGNVATDVLVEHVGPVMVVGPGATRPRVNLRGELVVPVDGSAVAETALDFVADWAHRLGERPWIVTVVARDSPVNLEIPDSAYPRRLAHMLTKAIRHPVEFETLHGPHPATAIADFSASIEASLILLSTHGRTGLTRLALGSVAAALVRHAPCPVVLVKPSHSSVASATHPSEAQT